MDNGVLLTQSEVIILPFMKPKMQTGVIVSTRKPDEIPKDESSPDDSGLEVCAQDIISALESKDAKKLAAAIKSAFQICEASPESDDGAEPHSYDAQNIKAAKDQE